MVGMNAAERLSEIMLPDATLRLLEPNLYSLYAPGEDPHSSYDRKGSLLQGVRNVLRAEGKMVFTTLIENNRCADRYLHMWARADEVVPRTAGQLSAEFEALGRSIKYRIQGNMAFITYG